LAGELLTHRHTLAGMLCYPISQLFNAVGFQEVDWCEERLVRKSRVQSLSRSLDGRDFALAMFVWLAFAMWMSHLFWTHQHGALVLPMNIHMAVLMFLMVSAYNAERTLRRSVPWLFISSFCFVLSDAIFGTNCTFVLQ
jgi:hypothetical protein